MMILKMKLTSPHMARRWECKKALVQQLDGYTCSMLPSRWACAFLGHRLLVTSDLCFPPRSFYRWWEPWKHFFWKNGRKSWGWRCSSVMKFAMRWWSRCNNGNSGAGTSWVTPLVLSPRPEGGKQKLGWSSASRSALQAHSSASSLTSLFSSDSEHLDTQKELLEEMYEEKLTILKESLTSFYQEELQVSCPEPVPTSCSDSHR